MKTQYKLLKDLPNYKAGTVFDVDNDGDIDLDSSTSGIGGWIRKPNRFPDYFQPLPQPKEEKKTYYISMLGFFGNELVSEHLDLTEPAAQAVAEAIKELLKVVNKPFGNYPRGGLDHWQVLDSKIRRGREAVQKDSDE